MPRACWWLLLAAACAAGAGLLWCVGSPAADLASAVAVAGDTGEASPRAQAESRRVVTAPVTAGLGSVRGRLVCGDARTPVVGVEVVAVQAGVAALALPLDARFEPDPMAAPAARVRSHSDGTFVLDGLERQGHLRLLVGAGTPLQCEVSAPMPLPRDHALDLGDVLLHEHTLVRGRLLGPDGAPLLGGVVTLVAAGRSGLLPASEPILLPDALQVLEPAPGSAMDRSESVAADADGRFVLTARAGRQRLVVCAPGMVGYTHELEPSSGAACDLGELRLSALAVVAGRVHDDAGQPVADVLVRAASATAMARVGAAVGHPLAPAVRTTPDGSFAAPCAAGGPRWFAVQRPGAAHWQVVGPFPAEVPVAIPLAPTVTAQIEILDQDGTALPDVRVAIAACAPDGVGVEPLASPLGLSWALRHPEHAPATATVGWQSVTGALQQVAANSGHWLLRGLPAGSYRLLVQAPEHLPTTAWITLRSGADHRLQLRLLRRQSQPLAVVDASGAPVAQVHVLWQADPGSGCWPAPLAVGVTDVAGRVVEPGLRRLGGRFVLLHPDLVPTWITLPREGSLPLRAVLAGFGALTGRVQGAWPGPLLACAAPAAGHAQPDVPAPDPVPVAAGGSYAFARVAPGPWQVTIVPHPGGPALAPALARTAPLAVGQATVVPAACAQLDLTLAPAGGGAITGTVRIGGSAGPGLSVRAMPLRDDGARRARAVSVATDDQGRFQISGLPNGEYQLSVADAGVVHRPLWLDRVLVTAGASASRDIRLELGELCVRVVGPRQAPVPDLEFLLLGGEHRDGRFCPNGLQLRATTDATGTARLPRVPSGTWQASARGGGLVVAAHEIVTSTTPLQVALEATAGR